MAEATRTHARKTRSTKERDPRSFVLAGGDEPVRSPLLCACCLAPPTRRVAVVKTERESYGVASITRTRSVEFPFCETCAQHVIWSRLGSASAIAIGAIVGVAVACFVAGVISTFVSGGLFHLSTEVVRDWLCALASVVAGALPGFAVARTLLAKRPAEPVSSEHTCAAGRSVQIVKFSDTFTQLAFARPEFGRAFAKLNR